MTVFTSVLDWIDTLPLWARGWVIVGAMAALGLVVHVLLYRAARLITRFTPGLGVLEGLLLARIRGPMRLLLPLVASRVGVGLGATARFFTADSSRVLVNVLDALIIITTTWLFVRITYVLEAAVFLRAEVDIEDNLEARRIRTRVVLLRRMLTVLVAVIGIAMVLLLHPTFRVLGTGILASAGVAGIVIGIAAQQPVRNLLAGIQIAITQPFRVDDVVIVEDEWGKIEEITLTYVVVRLWDLRRMVLPISYFVEKPFQNWTRTSASILGSVYLHVDYSAPVEQIRQQLGAIAEASPLWDRRVCVLQVTDLKERTMELRALVSASNASRAWDLRCEVREKLIGFLKEKYPGALPRVRAEVESTDDAKAATHLLADSAQRSDGR